jgi:hypothetical protein
MLYILIDAVHNNIGLRYFQQVTSITHDLETKFYDLLITNMQVLC